MVMIKYTRNKMIIAGVILLIILLTWWKIESDYQEKIEWSDRVSAYQEPYEKYLLYLKWNYNDFVGYSTEGKARSTVGSTSGSKYIAPTYTGSERIKMLRQEAEDYTINYERFIVAADEYYRFLEDNQKELRQQDYPVDSIKMEIQENKITAKQNLNKIKTELQRLAEQEQQNKELLTDVLKLLMVA